ncbi:MAG: NAD-dependent epimerase/dehydratase family protein [Sulfurimonas sp.]|jgi:UDP-glucose 4-epimerase
MNNILVTGAAGFIASHIIEELLKDENNSIIGIDNFYSGTKENINFLKSFDRNNKFTFLEVDIRNFDAVNKVVKQNNINQIYHLAAIASVQESIQNPLLSHEVNVKGTLNILEASRINSVRRVVFSSSAAVYGNEPTLPKNETSLTQPISPYGYEKLIGEQYMKLYNDLYRVETVSLRYFNVYGERQLATSDYSGVISIFEDKFKNNQIPTIYGNGEQFRDFIYVKDVAKINIKAMNAVNISGEIFCIGTAQKISINTLFFTIGKKYNNALNPLYEPFRDGDIQESLCDNTKLKSILNIKELKKFEEEFVNI